MDRSARLYAGRGNLTNYGALSWCLGPQGANAKADHAICIPLWRKSGRSAPVATTKPVIPTEDAETPDTLVDIWAPAAQIATVGIFIMLLGICLYLCRPLLLPVVAAVVIGITRVVVASHVAACRPADCRCHRCHRVGSRRDRVTFRQPVTSWIARAPEWRHSAGEALLVGSAAGRHPRIRRAFCLRPDGNCGRTLAVGHCRGTAFVTPAVAELVLFFVVLIFFLAAQMDFRRYMVSFFSTRDAKLRFIRITNDVEQNLASYVLVVTVINFCLGATVAFGAWMFGFATPVLFGLLAMALNYIPYLGAACMTAVLFAIGLVTFHR
jgi:hypothetical protein